MEAYDSHEVKEAIEFHDIQEAVGIIVIHDSHDFMGYYEIIEKFHYICHEEKIFTTMTGIHDNGNGSFVLDIGSDQSEEIQEQEQIIEPATPLTEKEKRKSARAAKPRSGGEPDVTRVCVWFDASSARAFRTAKMVYENAVGKQVTNGTFLSALLDGEWEKIPPSAKKLVKDFLNFTKKK